MKLLFGILLILLTGCEKPDPNPELKDPIYSDLLKESASLAKEAEEMKKALIDEEKANQKLSARDPAKGKGFRDLMAKRAHIVKIEERAKYFELKAKSRKSYAREAYLTAYSKKEPWPNPNEYKEYLEWKKLRAVNLNWGARVPKLGAAPVKKKEAAPPKH